MSKISLFLALFFFTQAASAACPIITGITPTSLTLTSPFPSEKITITGTGFNQTGATLNIAGGFGVETIPLPSPGFTVNGAGTEITIAASAIPSFSAPVGTFTFSVSSSSCVTPPSNHPFDYFTITGDWKALIPNTDGSTVIIADINGTGLFLSTNTLDIMFPFYVLSDPAGALGYCLLREKVFSFLSVVAISGINPTIVATYYANEFLTTTPTVFLRAFYQAMAISPSGKYLLVTGFDEFNDNWLLQLSLPLPALTPAITPVNAYNLGPNMQPTSVAFLPNSDDTAYMTGNNTFGNAEILVFDLTKLQSTSNPKTFTAADATSSNPTLWIAPAPVNKDFTSTSYVEMVLQGVFPNSSTAVFYNQLPATQISPYPKIFGGTGFAFDYISQIVASPDSTVAYVTNGGNSDGLALAVVDNLLGTPAISHYFTTPGTQSFTNNAMGIAITPDGQGGIVTDNSPNIWFLDTLLATATPIPVSGRVGYSCITPDQAPVAYAQVTNISGLTVSFDASASLSPTGFFSPTNNGIKNYIWDFGDGPPVTTTSPMITHTFASGGAKTVTLTVVNNAGTSTADKTRYFGQMNYNNGGPQAQLQLQVNLSPCNPNLLPPKVRISQRYFNCQYRNSLIITPPTQGPTPTSYLISADPTGKNVLRVVPANGSNPVRSKPIAAPCPKTCYYVFSVLDGSVSCDFTKSCSK